MAKKRMVWPWVVLGVGGVAIGVGYYLYNKRKEARKAAGERGAGGGLTLPYVPGGILPTVPGPGEAGGLLEELLKWLREEQKPPTTPTTPPPAPKPTTPPPAKLEVVKFEPKYRTEMYPMPRTIMVRTEPVITVTAPTWGTPQKVWAQPRVGGRFVIDEGTGETKTTRAAAPAVPAPTPSAAAKLAVSFPEREPEIFMV